VRTVPTSSHLELKLQAAAVSSCTSTSQGWTKCANQQFRNGIERRFWHSSRNTSEILSFKPYIEPAAVSLPLARGASCMLHTCDLERRDPIEPRLVNLARCGPWPPVAEAAAVLQPLARGATFRGCFKVGRNG
jgi:hypothetical protein